MSRLFEELDRQATPVGEISVRRRLDPTLGIDHSAARSVFDSCVAHEVRFPNHHTGGEGANTVYVARTAA